MVTKNIKGNKFRKILITGGNGFLGSHLAAQIRKNSGVEIRIPRSSEFDLRKQADCAKVVRDIDLVFHLAANVGGIGYNQVYPGTLFYDNVLMGVHLLEEARKAKVKKLVAVGTICAYPKMAPVPFKEADLWNGYPEETNAPYGLAKKMMLVQAQAYRQQYGFNTINLLLVNLYGPGDNFDLKKAHVIPALIRKFVEAKASKKSQVVIWGTGKATREFLYVKDAVRGILLAAERYNEGEPVNLGAGFEISIHDLALMIKELVGYTGRIVFDTTKPDGQPRRRLDVSRAWQYFGFKAQKNFRTGLRETVDWYLKNYH